MLEEHITVKREYAGRTPYVEQGICWMSTLQNLTGHMLHEHLRRKKEYGGSTLYKERGICWMSTLQGIENILYE